MDILFKNKNGKVFNYNTVEFCGNNAKEGCYNCPIRKKLGRVLLEDGECVNWVKENPEEAASLMGYSFLGYSIRKSNATNNEVVDDKVQKHLEIITKLNKLYALKNSDYGDSFGETYHKLGIISALTRISDKYNRLVSLATKPEEERKVKDESIQDTLLDLSNYCIMTIIEMEAGKENA